MIIDKEALRLVDQLFHRVLKAGDIEDASNEAGYILARRDHRKGVSFDDEHTYLTTVLLLGYALSESPVGKLMCIKVDQFFKDRS